MSRPFTRLDRVGATVGTCAALFLGTACASAGDPSSLAGQRLTGDQGDVYIPAAPPAVEHPYSLTGDETANYDRTHRDFTGPTGRWVETGQGRVWVSAAP